MSTLKNMKFRVASPQQSEQLQKVLFGLGYKWCDESHPLGVANHTTRNFLYAYDTGHLYYAEREGYFHDHENKEQDTVAFIAQYTKKEEKPKCVKPHKHAELIKIWADTGCEIEVSFFPGDWQICNTPLWSDSAAYRVKQDRIFPKSTLHRQDLLKIVQDTPWGFMDSYVAMADAAVKQYILDTEG